MNKRPSVNFVNEPVNTENCKYVTSEVLWSKNQENCWLINAWIEKSQGDDSYYYSVLSLSVRTIYDQNGLETKKLLITGLGWERIIHMNILVDSANPVSFLKQNVWYELKLRYTNIKIQAVNKRTKQLYCGFTDNTIITLGKVVVPTQSNGWICQETISLLREFPKEIYTLGNDNLPKLGKEVKKKKCPVAICTVSDASGKSKSNTLEILTREIFAKFKNLFNRISKIPNDRNVTHFRSPFKAVQGKGWRVPILCYRE